MAANSGIQWTTHTFNPWRGCTKVSPGCTNCYAEQLSGRNPRALGVWGPAGTRVVGVDAYWREPHKWDASAAAAGERHRVFCASLADVFEAPDTMPAASVWPVRLARLRLMSLIRNTPHLDWLLLTKRPGNVLPAIADLADAIDLHMLGQTRHFLREWLDGRPPANVWLGTSVEDQQRADERVTLLAALPAALRFLSVEPLLGAVNLTRLPHGDETYFDSLRGLVGHTPQHLVIPPEPARGSIDWVIVGGESGPGARPCQVEWIRDIVRQCRAAHVACFVKQLGAAPRPSHLPTDVSVRFIRDKKGGDPAEWPADLRVRELPKGAR